MDLECREFWTNSRTVLHMEEAVNQLQMAQSAALMCSGTESTRYSKPQKMNAVIFAVL